MSLEGKRIVIAGGSGFLGTSMATEFFRAGAKVTVLTRSKQKLTGDWAYQVWDGRSIGVWIKSIDGSDAIVNLAGRTVNCIKTPDHQDEILRSRIESTRVLGQAMRMVNLPPPVWVQMSTAHIYGDPPTAVCMEESAEGIGLAPTVSRAWEASGMHSMSWIHEGDINAIFKRAICDETMAGAYIVSSPNPKSQADFMRTLRKVIGMPIGLPALEWMVRIGAPLLMRTDPELVLYGRYVIPNRLLNERFAFQFAELEPALRDLYERKI